MNMYKPMDGETCACQHMGKPSNGLKAGLKIVGSIIFLISFGIFVGTVCYIQFWALRDVKNRLQKLESLFHISEDHNELAIRHKREINKEELDTVKEPEIQQTPTAESAASIQLSSRDCCSELAVPSFYDNSTFPENKTVTENETVTFYCGASGNPFPAVKWTFRDIVIKTGTRRYTIANNKQTLKITRTKIADSGLYSCEIENVFGTNMKSVFLNVFVPASVSVVPKIITVEEKNETNVSIVCTVWGIPEPTVTWYYQKQNEEQRIISVPVNNDTYPQTSTLVLARPNATDAGKYICTASTLYEALRSNSTLTVLSRPYIVDQYNNSELIEESGNFVILKCTVIAHPKPDITWIWKKVNGLTVGVHVDPTNGSLIIGTVNSFNSGEYECSANNSYGTAKASVHLVIKVDVRTSTNVSQLAMSSRTFVLQCSVQGDPPPNLVWTKNMGFQNSQSSSNLDSNTYMAIGNTLVIMPNGKDVSGVYTCTARNRFGNHQSRIIVYKELGHLDCEMNYFYYDREMDSKSVYGGTCPKTCWDTYDHRALTYSDICQAARTSNKTSPQGFVMWYQTDSYNFKLLA